MEVNLHAMITRLELGLHLVVPHETELVQDRSNIHPALQHDKQNRAISLTQTSQNFLSFSDANLFGISLPPTPPTVNASGRRQSDTMVIAEASDCGENAIFGHVRIIRKIRIVPSMLQNQSEKPLPVHDVLGLPKSNLTIQKFLWRQINLLHNFQPLKKPTQDPNFLLSATAKPTFPWF
jgi:hypothetical protein